MNSAHAALAADRSIPALDDGADDTDERPFIERFERFTQRYDRWTWVVFAVLNVATFTANVVVANTAVEGRALVPGAHQIAVCVVLLVVQAWVLRWRHRFPRGSMYVATGLFIATMLFAPANQVIATVSFYFAIFSFLRNTRGKRRFLDIIVVTIVSAVAHIINTWIYIPGVSKALATFGLYAFLRAALANGIVAILATWYGLLQRQSRLILKNENLKRRAEESRIQATLLLEHNRMARELHDVAAHRLTAIAVQAKGLLHKQDINNDAARMKLRTIALESEGAMQNMRAIVGILRQHNASAGTLPELSRLPSLLADLDQHSPDVDLTTSGDLETLSPATSLACYRVVQEGVTNARKHAPGATIQVRIDRGLRAVSIEIRNGPATAPDQRINAGGGFGIIGMRERIVLLNGTFSNGPTASGGWFIQADIPLNYRSVPMATE